MQESTAKRFIFLGGIPVFDYMINVKLEEIAEATENQHFIVGSRLLLPVGTIFEVRVQSLDETMYINPMANREVQYLHNDLYYSMEFGGKHPESYEFTLCADKQRIFREITERFPAVVKAMSDLKVVHVSNEAQLELGGNNKNIVEAIRILYASPQLNETVENISFEHHFFADTRSPKFQMVRDLYDSLGISIGDLEAIHVDDLCPRIGYVLTVTSENGEARDRIILANRSNEEIIPVDQWNRKYLDIEHRLRRDEEFVETHLVINSMTNHEELRNVARILKTSYASGVISYLCPTLTFLKCVDALISARYYTTERERFFQYRRDFVYSAILPYIQYMILNRDELELIDNVVTKRGIDATASSMAHQMNRGKRGETDEGGKVIVTGGSKGARYTERLKPERARLFWEKANLPGSANVRFAERRIVCGDDYVDGLTSTLGAGDVFTGTFIGLNALGWDGGHTLRAATLGAQHFIRNRTKPRIADMIAIDAGHVRMGTETELVDVVSHHVETSGDPTRYGTISDTVVTIKTTQIHHPFREILEVATGACHRQALRPEQGP